MYVTSVSKVEENKMNAKGAHGVKIKYLLHERIGAKRLQLRLFSIDVGGYTPLEKHKHEHEVFILHGKALVRGGDTETIVKEGDVIFISSWEEHQFRNMGKEKLQFLCTKETVE
jgi:mannose-6-phosphate isomerase-like protein (cupin superfamily)